MCALMLICLFVVLTAPHDTRTGGEALGRLRETQMLWMYARDVLM